MDIREALYDYLTADATLEALHDGRVFPVIRQQSTDGAALVYRLTKGVDGQVLSGDSTEREYTFEIVAWGRDFTECIALGNRLKVLFHGTYQYVMGGAGGISIDESNKVTEYDGDRITDSFADAGEVAITYVFEFRWVA